MKKLFVSMAVLAFFSMSANAQFLLGGRVGFSSDSKKQAFEDFGNNIETKSVERSFVLSPVVGYELSEKLEVGGMISLGSEKTYYDKANDKDVWSKTFSYAISPYAQYSFASFGKFNLKVEASASFGQDIPSQKNGKEKIDGDKTTYLSLAAYPLISYDLNEHIELEAQLNFFGFVASSEITKDADNSDNKTVENSFGFSGNAGNIATTGLITVGFMYKF